MRLQLNDLKIKLFLLAFMGLFFSNNSFSQTCNIDFQNDSISIVWDRDFQYQQIFLPIRKINNEACTIRLGFTKGGAATYNERKVLMDSRNINYQLYKTVDFASPLKDGTDIVSADEYIVMTFPEGENITQNFFFYIKVEQEDVISPQYKKEGTYTDTFEIRAYDSEPMTTAIDSASINFSLVISRILELSLVPVGESFDSDSVIQELNLGNLEYSREGQMDLIIRTNAGYKVYMASENGGKLVHETYSPILNSIPYNFYYNNVLQTLTKNPQLISTFSGETDTDGAVNRLKVVTEQASNVAAGSYSDRITITIDPDL